MTEGLKIAIISAASAVAGGLVGGAITIWSAKMSADREDRRRREELERKTALERIENLYEPLFDIIRYYAPEGLRHIHDAKKEEIIRTIEDIKGFRTYASPDLLQAFWRFKHDYPGKLHKDEELFVITSSEHATLKEITGFGKILKKSWIKTRLRRILRKIY